MGYESLGQMKSNPTNNRPSHTLRSWKMVEDWLVVYLPLLKNMKVSWGDYSQLNGTS